MKAIFALMGASVLMIVLGITLILMEDGAEEERQARELSGESEQARDIGVIPAPAEDESEIPQLEVDAEPGTEQWCEQMMKQPDSEWSDQDARNFADNCIYE